ncbi:gelsolin-related protein of 125 kDa-like [Mercenaria mercenaria]|uniref:gelsolin-related protein of 125 kDa-like n=1 Tax=Mercenaria mercenaria TaxID=6596 RepID=UPI00234E848A|nr:gelsolin-related protein of 125 kDa-like [Mercenaria mercenaria]
MEKCWLCTRVFYNVTELKAHLVSSAHRRQSVVCPWCFREERTFTRVNDLYVHCKQRHFAATNHVPKNVFGVAAGFYMAIYPVDYAKIVTPSPWDSTEGMEVRRIMSKWIHSLVEPAVKSRNWRRGWRNGLKEKVLGTMKQESKKEKSVEKQTSKESKSEKSSEKKPRKESKKEKSEEKLVKEVIRNVEKKSVQESYDGVLDLSVKKRKRIQILSESDSEDSDSETKRNDDEGKLCKGKEGSRDKTSKHERKKLKSGDENKAVVKNNKDEKIAEKKTENKSEEKDNEKRVKEREVGSKHQNEEKQQKNEDSDDKCKETTGRVNVDIEIGGEKKALQEEIEESNQGNVSEEVKEKGGNEGSFNKVIDDEGNKPELTDESKKDDKRKDLDEYVKELWALDSAYGKGNQMELNVNEKGDCQENVNDENKIDEKNENISDKTDECIKTKEKEDEPVVMTEEKEVQLAVASVLNDYDNKTDVDINNNEKKVEDMKNQSEIPGQCVTKQEEKAKVSKSQSQNNLKRKLKWARDPLTGQVRKIIDKPSNTLNADIPNKKQTLTEEKPKPEYTCTKLNPGTEMYSQQARELLSTGVMPLVPPARRDWNGQKMELDIGEKTLEWPPSGWLKMTPDRKLLA